MSKKKRPSTYAERTCRACRGTKKKCQMPSSSLLQLPSEEGVDPCVRCKDLNLVCILDDYSKRSKVEYAKRQLKKAFNDSPQSHDASPKNGKIVTPRSNLLTLELIRKVNLASTEGKKGIQRRPRRPASMSDLDALIDDDVCQNLSWWSHNELRLWFPFLKTPSQLRLLRKHSSSCSPSHILLEAGQYFVAANHLSMLGDGVQEIVEIAENLIKTSLAEVLLSTTYDDDSLLALQLVTFFQVSDSISLPMLSASTKAAQLAMTLSNSVTKKLAWCSASVWEACIFLGTESGLQLFRPENFPTLEFVKELSSIIDMEDVAMRAILLRTRNIAILCDTWQRMEGPECIGQVLASWSQQLHESTLSIDDLDILQQPFVQLEVDAANTIVQGRALSLTLGDDVAIQVARLANSEEMLSYNYSRRQLIGLSSGADLCASFTTHQKAAHRLLSKLFQVASSSPDKMMVKTQIGSNPVLYGIGYIYEAATLVLQAQAPLLDWMSKESSNIGLHNITALLQSILAADKTNPQLEFICAQVERDYILDDPLILS